MSTNKKSRGGLPDGFNNEVRKCSNSNNSIIPPSSADVKPQRLRDLVNYEFTDPELADFLNLDVKYVAQLWILIKRLVSESHTVIRNTYDLDAVERCLRDLGELFDIPAFFAFCDPPESFERYRVIPLNHQAEFYGEPTVMTPEEYEEFVTWVQNVGILAELTAEPWEVTPCR